MKAIDRRLRRLENRHFPPVDEEALRIASEIRERRGRHLEAEGWPFIEDDRPQEDLRGMTIAGALRNLRFGRREVQPTVGSI